MTTNDGGPAFPTQDYDRGAAQAGFAVTVTDNPGMSLRDWFAGQAMAAFIKRAASAEDWARLAPVSYECADVMLAARNSTSTKET